MYKAAAKVEQRATSDTKWKWKSHHHNSKAVRKRFFFFHSTSTARYCTFRLCGVPRRLTHPVRSFMAFIFHFSVAAFVQLFWPSLFRFRCSSNKSISSTPLCAVCILFMLHMTERHMAKAEHKFFSHEFFMMTALSVLLFCIFRCQQKKWMTTSTTESIFWCRVTCWIFLRHIWTCTVHFTAAEAVEIKIKCGPFSLSELDASRHHCHIPMETELFTLCSVRTAQVLIYHEDMSSLSFSVMCHSELIPISSYLCDYDDTLYFFVQQHLPFFIRYSCSLLAQEE